MKAFRMALAIVAAILLAYTTAANDQRVAQEAKSAGFVSMYALIARPRDFDGKIVAIVGVLAPLSRDAAIYPNTDSRAYGWLREAIYLRLSEDQQRKAHELSNEFVGVTGVFSYSGDDTTDNYLGRLKNVTAMYGLQARTPPD